MIKIGYKKCAKPYVYMKILLLIAIPFAVSGCYQLDKILHKGSVRAFASCLEDKKDLVDVLSEYSIRSACLDENHESLPRISRGEMTGSIALNYLNERTGFRASRFSLEEIPEGFIITEVILIFYFFDENGEVFEIIEPRKTWIEGPQRTYSAQFGWDMPFPDGLSFENNEFGGSCNNMETRRNCFSWNIFNVKVLTY